MRKLFFILSVLASFALGLASQGLFASSTGPTFDFPEPGSAAPTETQLLKNGGASYRLPDNDKAVGYTGADPGNVKAKRESGTNKVN